MFSDSSNDHNHFLLDGDSPYNSLNIDCNYSSISDYNKQGISILSLNIQSLNAKYNDLKDFIYVLTNKNSAPDVICLQELWRFPEMAEFSILGYQPLVHKLRNNHQGGGVGIYLKMGIKGKIDTKASVFHERIFESLIMELTLGKTKIIVGSIYRPGTKHPNMSLSDQNNVFLELLSNCLDDLSLRKTDVFLLGDLNIDVLKYDNSYLASEYIDLLFSNVFLQTITRPTRCTNTSASLIDHCITNANLYKYSSHILTEKISDHFPIIITATQSKICNSRPTRSFRDFSDTNIQKFKLNFGRLNWRHIFHQNNVDVAFNNFSDTFNQLYDLHFPVKTIQINKNIHPKDPWFTKGLLVSRNRKFQLSKLASKNPTAINKQNFNTYRNIYNRVVRLAKCTFFETSLMKNQSDLKKTWKLIRMATNRKPKNRKQESVSLKINNILTDDPSVVATTFNEFFSAIPHQISATINRTNHPESESNSSTFTPLFDIETNPISHEEILKTVAELEPKSSYDLNNVSMVFIKKCIAELLNPLHIIFNLSFKTGVVPNRMKTAKVVPIFKAGDPSSPDNYRPISLINNFSKILEKIMANRLTNFLEFNNIISDYQFGFRKGHSTVHPMIHFNNFITDSFNKKQHAIAIFCDLKKAFDTVDHKLLIIKLKRYGVAGLALDWFKSYLSNRKQFVYVNGSFSSEIEITIGVPQGSVLGPLLFLLYINDLPQVSKLFSLLFADDTTLLAAHNNLDYLINFVNVEFKKITDYFRKNRLSLHPDKTKFVVFSQSRNIDYDACRLIINNNNDDDIEVRELIRPIGRISGNDIDPAIRFLGLQIDPELNFKFHVEQIIKKISSALYFLRNAKKCLTDRALKSVYFSIIHSHIIYAIHVWSSCPQYLINKIFVLQKKAIRIISNAPYNAHTESLFKKQKILPLPSLIDFFKIQFMQQFSQGLLPKSFTYVWTTNEARALQQNLHDYPLRNSNNLYIPFARLKSTEKHPLHLFPKLWSEFNENDIKYIRCKHEFNSKLKAFFLNKLQDNFRCSRMLCPRCHLQNVSSDSD